jgi:hypothetical protein
VSTPQRSAAAARSVRLDVVLTALHVRVPREGRAPAAAIWNHVREDVFDSATSLRLRQNGVRAGVGNLQWWDAVMAALNAVDDVVSLALDPVRIPPGYPLALELDTAPHEQTLFYVADDGVLTGETWPQSRNVLRVMYSLNLETPDRVRLEVVPEVRQRLEGFRWVRTEAGLTQEPNANGRTFTAAGFATDLAPGEFLLIAPSEQADLYGIVGGAFLGSEEEGRRYDAYVFLRADVNHVALRN